MDIREALKVINLMQADGVIGRWAIGGAVGATFYLEPISTLDIDIFVTLAQAPGSLLVSLQPIHDWLLARGCAMSGEHVVIAGWPVQFLPPTSPLVEEALAQAALLDVEGTSTPVFSAEHLAAISLETGRAKDKARLLQFIESGAVDMQALRAILARHGLEQRWQRFEASFLGEP
jgi:hypothetical protein